MRIVLFAFLGILVLTTIWFLAQCPPFHREQVPGILRGDLRNGSAFSARLDDVRYGSTTKISEAPYDYVIIFLKKPDGAKIGVIVYKPDLETLELVRSLKEGTTYEFPKVFSRVLPESIRHTLEK